jgi:prolyl-tRNA editing enzyme YbaK/EbsC (Cys-tRNA(Pro) deacylase)
MKDALDVHRSLLAREVPHEIVRLPRLALSADEIPELMGLPRERCVATRLYWADRDLVAVVVRAGELPHPASLLGALGASSLRTASADEVNALTDFAASLICPVLLPPSIRVLADSCVGTVDVVYAATGDGGTALGIRSRWLLTASGAAVTELCGTGASSIDVSDDLDREFTELTTRQRDWR